jgi:hypothetical protein
MSTSFDVYPRTRELPTFAALIERSSKELHSFLDSIGISERPPIHLRLQRCEGDSHVPFSLGEPAQWSEDLYAWFMVGKVPGGTDAYFDNDADQIKELWDGELDDPKCKRLEPLIRECVAIGHRWWFRRSAGQPAIINLVYGLIAGSLAAITDGFVYSSDSAWDWERMPARPQELLSWYFRPEQAIEENLREWSRRCLDVLGSELRAHSE